MKLTLEQEIDLLDQEIRWCIENPSKAPNVEYQEGFIEGLEQAKHILKAAQHPRPLQTTSSRVLIIKPDYGEPDGN